MAGIGSYKALRSLTSNLQQTLLTALHTPAWQLRVHDVSQQQHQEPPPQQQQRPYTSTVSEPQDIRWVFLGPPGVGKGTYASRVSKHFDVAHIATGDLIRQEIKARSSVGQQMQSLVEAGKLVPDDLIFHLLKQRLAQGQAQGERGFILDGFPRTEAQARGLLAQLHIQLALNMSLREEVLVKKCLGRRLCTHCGKNYNVADIYLAARGSDPEIRMPPLSPPPTCVPHLEVRTDDREEVVRARLQAYRGQAEPVEQVFREAGVLKDFEITAGIPETLPGLLETLAQYVPSQLGNLRVPLDQQVSAAKRSHSRSISHFGMAEDGVPIV